MNVMMKELMAWAKAEVEATMEVLPRAVRDRAVDLPVSYAAVPGDKLVEDGVDPDLMGLFVGEAFTEEGLTTDPMPAQILLFVENIWMEAEEDRARFREEVRTTYLHELGHYLGLDEPDLAERGLE